MMMFKLFIILFTLCPLLRGEFVISDTVSQVWEQASKNNAKRHRSFFLVSESNIQCTASLFSTKTRVESFNKSNESQSTVIKACERATSWPIDSSSLVEINDRTTTSVVDTHIELMFVIASYVSNVDNAKLLNLTLGGIVALHPYSDILIVDSHSPEPDLIQQIVQHFQSFPNIYKIGDITISRAELVNEKLPGKEIGALRNAITFIETKRSKPPPQFVAFLSHSTGLRIALPVAEMMTLYESNICQMFPLDIPWFRYEKNQHLESQYGVSADLVRYLHLKNKIPKGYAQSKANVMWHGVTHGIFAFPWLVLRNTLRNNGILSDAAQDQCSLVNCCCWEQHSGMMMDWTAVGTTLLREAWKANIIENQTEFESVEVVSEKYAKLANATGTLADLRCTMPVTWKLHGLQTKREPINSKARKELMAELRELAKEAKLARESRQNSCASLFFSGNSDSLAC